MATLKKAIEIATDAHMGKKDKAGQPYIGHPTYVMNKMKSEKLKIIAILHDVVEDCPEKYDFNKLREAGFGDSVIISLTHLTRSKEENYWDYLRRVADNDAAISVKLADLRHNSDLNRIPSPTPVDIARREKYLKAIQYLKEIKAFKAKNRNLTLTKPPYKYILTRLLFGVIREDYAAFCRTLNLILESASRTVCSSAIVQGRAKNLDSFTEKCIRKAEKYGDSNFKLMTDLCGNRVILQTTGQVADFCEFIKQHFEVDWENSEDTGTRLGDAEFGYISQHFIVSFKPETTDILGVPVDAARFAEIKAEIQVRTLSQHIVADTLHDRMYKSAVSPLKEHKREAAVIAAILENADAVVHRFVTDYDIFSLHHTSYMTVVKTEEEIKILEVKNFSEKYIFTEFVNTLTMAGYLRNLGRNDEIAVLLKPFVEKEKREELKLDKPNQTRLWFEYGFSLLSSDHDEAHKYINKALDNYKGLETDHSDKWLEARRFYVFMLTTAGTLDRNVHWLNRALRIDFTNPYACAGLLEATTLDHSLLRGAVADAEKHLRAGINEPEVYFVLGRIHLALRHEDHAFKYYIDGLLFYLAKAAIENADGKNHMIRNLRIKQILGREIKYLDGSESAIADALVELLNHTFDSIYKSEPDTAVSESKTIWCFENNDVLSASAGDHVIKILKSTNLAGCIREMAEEPGYLFLEKEDETLVKASLGLVLGLRVVSTCEEMNNKLVTDDKIRKTVRFYTLPCEAESLKALFADRKHGFTEAQIDAAAKNGHEKYVAKMFREMRQSGKQPPYIEKRTRDWISLDPEYKNANTDKAEYAAVLFGYEGYELNADANGALGWDDIPDDVQLRLAKWEHGRWNAERVVTGWCYYPKRDDGKLLNNNITCWDGLTAEMQGYDFDSIRILIDDFKKVKLYLHRK